MKQASFVAALAALGTMISPAAAPTASACGNGYEIRVDPRTGAVSEAEKLVNAGKPDEAARRLISADPTFANATPGKGPLQDRALLVLAKAVVRSDGRVIVGVKEAADGSEGAQSKKLAWAVGVTRALASKRTDDPALSSDLGELLARVPTERAEARRLLESLEKRDVVASPYAYAALARLRAERASGAPPHLRAPLAAFEAARRELELARCAGMTKDPSICTAAVTGS